MNLNTATADLAAMLAAPIDPRTVPVRFSALKQMALSPLHYFHACQDQTEQTLSMRLGSGAHGLLFGKPVVQYTGKVRNGKAWEAFEAEHADSVILNAREMAEARAIADAVRANPVAMRLIEGAVCEQRIDWRLGERACRSTPDARSRLHVVDLKSTQCSEPSKFRRDAFFRHYHAQLAFYCDAIKASGEGEPMEAYIIAVESSAPYPVSVLRLTDRAIESGRWLYEGWFQRVLECEHSGQWPGYIDDVIEWDVEV